ncbi:MAG TPA: glycosyltransferase family 2 protein [Solirubrobacterales bacterium]
MGRVSPVVSAVREASAGQADDVRLMVPSDDVADPELSIVIPALDEELTIGEFVEWCREGLRKAGVVGEILIVDSSADRTAELALSKGARVLATPKRGLGRAYIDALPFIRGRYVLMGDADCTYDFRELAPFVERMREGYEFVMGSRWKGYIEPGSMPWLHRYLGTPVTTWILNVVYSSHFTDIHCGMRGITRDGLERMDLQSQSWEYASEMVLKSVHMELQTAEVPVRFLTDPEGRESHHKRAGWLSPFKAAWINLRAMFTYGVEFFVFKPGLIALTVGLAITLPLTFGPITIGSVTLSLYTMLLGVTLALLGLQSFFIGCLAQVLHDYDGSARRRWLRIFPYNRTVVLCALAFLVGLGLAIQLVVTYSQHDLALPESARSHAHLAVTGLLLMIGAFMTFTFTLLLNSEPLRKRSPHDDDAG